MRYATTEHLAHYLSDAVPEHADALLSRAARIVDRLALHLRYDVDDTGEPSDPTVRAALRDATCAQVQAWVDTGQATPPDGAGVELAAAGLGSVSFGGLTLGTGAAGSVHGKPGSAPDWTSPSRGALDELARAGLWPPQAGTR